MKIPISFLIFLALVVSSLEAQSTTQSQVSVPAPTPYTIVNQDGNSQVWQREEYEAGPNGQIITHVEQYREIASGLNYLDAGGNWQPSQETIEIQPDGTAASLQGQHKVHFPIDLANGRITLVTPSGLEVSSEPLQLSYWDGTNAVVLAELTNSVGVLVASNQIVYPNAFSGLKADIQYTVTRAGLEQDVILHQQPLTPEYYHLSPGSCCLQMVSAFFNSPNPITETTTLPPQAGITLEDQSIGFGQMQMVLGRAFVLGQSEADPGALVAKSWLETGGMQFLVEEVPVNAIVEGLETLPLTAMNGSSNKTHYLASRRVELPRHRTGKTSTSAVILAKGNSPTNGFNLDYLIVNSSMTNVTFQGDTTYFVSGATYLYGASTFEPGSVIKFTNNASLDFPSANPVINWLGSAYRPVIFTAKDDNSVGFVITGSSGSPSGDNYGNPVLDFYDVTSLMTLPNIRISWAATAISVYNADLYIYNSQFVNCRQGFSGASGGFYLRNTLFANVLTNLTLGSINVDFQNCTFASNSCVAANNSGTMALTFTNCIFANIGVLSTNSASLTINGDHNGFYNCATFGSDTITTNASPFQTVGAGGYYLASGGNFHNAGTTNIDPMLLANLSQATTYPPLVYSNKVFNVPTNMSPQAARDSTGNPALGFHYCPLDYVFGGCDLYTNLTCSAGTAVGWFMSQGHVSSSGEPYGISLNSGACFTTTGTATSPCWVAEYNNVQEGSVPWNNSGWMGALMLNGSGSGTTPQINSTFTKWGPPGSTLFIRDNWDRGSAAFANCEFYDGYIATYDTSSVYFTNCLFWRDAFQGYDQDTTPIFTMLNCTLYDGDLVLVRYSGLGTPMWTIENTSFDGTAFATYDYLSGSSTYTVFNYNAYNTNNLSWQSYPQPYVAPTNTLEVIGSKDKLIPGYNWQPSWFGTFYLPTNSPIIQKGSTNANLLGLFYYTVTTNEVIEATNTVSIGYHYIATDAFGNPLDTYTNGIPDYLEDANGSLGVWELHYFGNIGEDLNSDYDGDGNTLLYDYTNGIDPNIIGFSFSFANQYVSTNIVNGVITILGGVPSSIAVLVDSTNFTTATWTAYSSSNLSINLGSSQGAHDVWVGLRGLPSDGHQTWEDTTIILDTNWPTILITNPANNASFNSSRVDVGGNFSSSSLQQITVNGVPAFVNGTNFEVLNVPLNPGSNIVTAVVEDFTGATNAASITLIGLTNSDGSMNDPVDFQATPIAGFAPLPVTFQITSNNVPGSIELVSYDFTGDGIPTFVTNNLSPVTYTYATNGEYFPVVTIQFAAGTFSSSGGWNSTDPNRLQITVQSPPIQSTFANVADPVALKWNGTNLYVLSGSSGTITEFATNGTSVGSSLNIGASCSGFDVDATGNIYAAVTVSNQVWKFILTNSSYVADTTFGAGGFIGNANGSAGTGSNQFDAPFDVALSPDGGTVSVSDSGNDRIQQFAATDGSFIAAFGTNGSGVGQFNTPKGLTYDSVGTLYIVDSGNSRIAVSQDSGVVGVTGTNGTALGQFSGPVNVSVDERGVYVADTGNNRIQSFSPPVPDSLFSIDPSTIGFAVSSGLSAPAAVAAVDNLTNEMFYVADTGNNRIVLYTLGASDPTATWTNLTTLIATGDIEGALSTFSIASIDKYRRAFLSIGNANIISEINQIGALTPVYILDDKAEYYFQQTVTGETITFPVEFDKENGVWKILEF